MKGILTFFLKRPRKVIVAAFIITLFMAYQALQIRIDGDITRILPRGDNPVDTTALNGYFFISIEAPEGELFSLEGLKAYEKVIKAMEAKPDVLRSFTPFNFVTLRQRRGGRLAASSFLKGKRAPRTEEELKEFQEGVEADPFIRGYLYSQDGKVLTSSFLTTRVVADNKEFMDGVRELLKELESLYTVRYSGDIAFGESTELALTRDFTKLVFLAIGVILIVMYLMFQAKRAIFLPLSVVIMGSIWCLGLTSLLGFRLTVVNSFVPALVLTIGSSYTIHIINEFFRMGDLHEEGDNSWIVDAVLHVNKTIVIACLTTIVGFLSLLFASQELVREFALSVSLGIFSVALLSLFYLPCVFALTKKPQLKHMEITHRGLLTRCMGGLGRVTARFPKTLILLGFGVVAAFVLMIPGLTIGADYITYFPQDDRIVEDTMAINKAAGGTQWINVTFKAPEGSDKYFLSGEGLQKAAEFESQVRGIKNVYDVISYPTILKDINQIRRGIHELPASSGNIKLYSRFFRMMFESSDSLFKEAALMNEDFSEITFIVRCFDLENGTYIAESDFPVLLDSVKKVAGNTLKSEPQIWGLSLLFGNASLMLLKDQSVTMIASFLFVFLIAAFFFRSVAYGIVTLIPLVTGICVNYIVMVSFQIPLDITTIMVSSVAIGVGVDDAIHFIIQYRNQLKLHPDDINRVLFNTFKITGRPIVLTTVSIVAGMMVLCVATFKPIMYFGILVSLALVGALIGTLLFLPAILKIFYRPGKVISQV